MSAPSSRSVGAWAWPASPSSRSRWPRDLAQSGLPAGQVPGQGGSLLEKVFQVHAQSLTETLQINPHRAVRADRAGHRQEPRESSCSPSGCRIRWPTPPTASSCCWACRPRRFDSHIQLIAATQLQAGDVAIGISLSGTTRETVECLEVAKAKGATTICLTNAMKSPITTHSDCCLYATPSEIKYFQAPLASRVTQLALIDALFVFLALKHKSRTAAKLQASGEELIKRPVS